MRSIIIFSIFIAAHAASYAQSVFCNESNSTFFSSNVLFPSTLVPTVDGNTLPYGSYIIAIFNNGGIWECAGSMQWNGNSISMVINGDDGTLSGYLASEHYKFAIQLPDGCLLDSVNVVYDVSGIYNNPGVFQDGGLSKVAVLSAYSQNWVALEATDGFCGENTAQITATTHNLSAPYSYQWSNGGSAAINQNLPSGNYSVTVTDVYGCSQSNAADVNNTPAMLVELQTMPSPVGSFCESTAIVTGGTAPFVYLWSNGQIAAMASELPDGDFSVTVTDASGCTAIQNETCMTVGTEDIRGVELLSINPNPANTYLWIHVELTQLDWMKIRLINAFGQPVYERNHDGKGIEDQIDLAHIPAGFYFLQVSTSSGSKSEIISVVR